MEVAAIDDPASYVHEDGSNSCLAERYVFEAHSQLVTYILSFLSSTVVITLSSWQLEDNNRAQRFYCSFDTLLRYCCVVDD